MDYPYKEVAKGFFRPIAPIFVRGPKKQFGYEALIDSGADSNIFHADITKALGLNLTIGQRIKFGGITGDNSNGYVHTVNFEIAGHTYQTPIIFSEKIPDFGYGILGQSGFFSEFTVKFNYSDLKVRVPRPI